MEFIEENKKVCENGKFYIIQTTEWKMKNPFQLSIPKCFHQAHQINHMMWHEQFNAER